MGRLHDGVLRRHPLDALRVQREVDHHNGILFHDANQHDDSDERVDVEFVVEQQQDGQGAQAGRG